MRFKFHFFRYTPSFTVRLHYLYLSAFSSLSAAHTRWRLSAVISC